MKEPSEPERGAEAHEVRRSAELFKSKIRKSCRSLSFFIGFLICKSSIGKKAISAFVRQFDRSMAKNMNPISLTPN